MDIYNHKKRKYTDMTKKKKRKINEVYIDQINLNHAKINVVKNDNIYCVTITFYDNLESNDRKMLKKII